MRQQIAIDGQLCPCARPPPDTFLPVACRHRAEFDASRAPPNGEQARPPNSSPSSPPCRSLPAAAGAFSPLMRHRATDFAAPHVASGLQLLAMARDTSRLRATPRATVARRLLKTRHPRAIAVYHAPPPPVSSRASPKSDCHKNAKDTKKESLGTRAASGFTFCCCPSPLDFLFVFLCFCGHSLLDSHALGHGLRASSIGVRLGAEPAAVHADLL